MAYSTESKLNNNLKQVSDIGIYKSYKDGVYTRTMYLPYNGSTNVWFGFRQPNDLVNPYQIQHRESYRYTADLAKQKGQDWTGWVKVNGEEWKNSRAMAASGSAYPAIAYGATKPIMNKWRRANKGVDTQSLPTTAFMWENWSFGENYEAVALDIRIRTYNYATATHGAMVTQHVEIYRCADVQDVECRLAPDGGLYVMFNYQWSRAISARIKSVLNADGQECLAGGELVVSARTQSRASGSSPAANGTMKGALIHIPREKLNYQFFYNKDLTIDLDILTDRKAPTSVQATKVLAGITNIAQPTLTLEVDGDKGTITATAEHSNSAQINDLNIVLLRADFAMQVPISVVKEPGKTVATWAVNMDGTQYRALAVASNKFDLPRASAQKTVTVPKSNNVYFIGKGANLGTIFTLRGEFALDVTRELANTNEKPLNRALSMVAWGYGVTSTVNLSGVALDGRYMGDSKDNAIASTNTLEALEQFSRNQGEYALRLPNGKQMDLVITNVSWTQENAYKADVSIEAVEVDYVE